MRVKEALLTRLNQLEGSGIITPSGNGVTIEGLLNGENLKDGGLLVVNLKEKTVITSSSSSSYSSPSSQTSYLT